MTLSKEYNDVEKNKESLTIARMTFLHHLQFFITTNGRMEILLPFFKNDTALYSIAVNNAIRTSYVLSIILNPLMLELSKIFGRLNIINFGVYYRTATKLLVSLFPTGNIELLTAYANAPGEQTINSFSVYLSDIYKGDATKLAAAQAQKNAYTFAGLIIGPLLGGFLVRQNVRLPYLFAGMCGLGEMYLSNQLKEYVPKEDRMTFGDIDYSKINPFGFIKLFLSGGKMAALSFMHICSHISGPRGYGIMEDLLRTEWYGNTFSIMDRSYIKSFSSVLLVVGYANGGRLVKAFGGASKLFFTSSLILILQRLYQWLFSKTLFMDYLFQIINLSKPLSDVGSNVMLRQEAKRQNVKPAELEVMLGNMEEITSVFCYPAWAMVYAYCLRSNDVRRWYGALAFITSVQYVLGTYANSS